MTLAQLAVTVALLGGLGLVARPFGLVFLLFFLGLEFSLGRLLRSSRHLGLGGLIDFATNAAIGLVLGVAAFGFSFGALILAAAVYVSSSAITVKGLIDF